MLGCEINGQPLYPPDSRAPSACVIFSITVSSILIVFWGIDSEHFICDNFSAFAKKSFQPGRAVEPKYPIIIVYTPVLLRSLLCVGRTPCIIEAIPPALYIPSFLGARDEAAGLARVGSPARGTPKASAESVGRMHLRACRTLLTALRFKDGSATGGDDEAPVGLDTADEAPLPGALPCDRTSLIRYLTGAGAVFS